MCTAYLKRERKIRETRPLEKLRGNFIYGLTEWFEGGGGCNSLALGQAEDS